MRSRVHNPKTVEDMKDLELIETLIDYELSHIQRGEEAIVAPMRKIPMCESARVSVGEEISSATSRVENRSLLVAPLGYVGRVDRLAAVADLHMRPHALVTCVAMLEASFNVPSQICISLSSSICQECIVSAAFPRLRLARRFSAVSSRSGSRAARVASRHA